MPFERAPTRRLVTLALGATLLDLSSPRARAQAPAEPKAAEPKPAAPDAEGWRELRAAPLRFKLKPDAPEIDAWAFDGQVPGPAIRVRLGEEVRLRLVNDTPKPLSLHFQGLRGPNAVDGLGGLTQEPVPPGGRFDYRLTPPDAGVFLGRPLVAGGSAEPAERGLSVLLVVEETEPPRVDAEFALVVDDWRLEPDGRFSPFGGPEEAATGGRLGNLLTVGGKPAPQTAEVPPGARVRLRLANACNARSTRIRFDNLKCYVAAVDGQPTDAFEPLRSTLPFSPGTRYDLLVDMPEEAGASGAVIALLGTGTPLLTLKTVAPAAGGPARPAPGPVRPLPENKLLPPAIKLQNALRRELVIAGGATRGPDGQFAFRGDPARIWTVNGAVGSARNPPAFSVRRGAEVVLALVNQTPVVQPVHLHGHVFRLLHPLDDGWEPYWLDTLQIPENRTVRIAFLAGQPGKWALSSAVLERFDTGLWTWFEVT